MTGLVRKATLLGVGGLLAASVATANVPNCSQSKVPDWIFVVGFINSPAGPHVDGANGPPYIGPNFGSNDPDGIPNNDNVIIIRDAFGSPIANVGVHIKFPCDVNLCTTQPLGATVTCDLDGNTLHGITDMAGRFEFIATGSSKDIGGQAPYFPIAPPYPTQPGGGFQSTVVTVDGADPLCVPFKRINAVVLDLDGIISSSVGGTDAQDLGKERHNALTMIASLNTGTGSIYYRARADQNSSSSVDALDIGTMRGHSLQVLATHLGSRDCVDAGLTFCAKNPCP
jgi:hypothetical protein